MYVVLYDIYFFVSFHLLSVSDFIVVLLPSDENQKLFFLGYLLGIRNKFQVSREMIKKIKGKHEEYFIVLTIAMEWSGFTWNRTEL